MAKVLCLIALIGCGIQTNYQTEKDQIRDLCIEKYLETLDQYPYDSKQINSCIENPGVAILKQIEADPKEKDFNTREIQ